MAGIKRGGTPRLTIKTPTNTKTGVHLPSIPKPSGNPLGVKGTGGA